MSDKRANADNRRVGIGGKISVAAKARLTVLKATLTSRGLKVTEERIVEALILEADCDALEPLFPVRGKPSDSAQDS